MNESVRLEGWAEFRQGLRDAPASIRRILPAAGKRLAEIVVPEAQRSARAAGGVAVKAAGSIRAGGTAAGGFIASGKGQPYFMGANFGSIRYRQFDDWVGKTENDYFMLKSVREKRPEVQDQALDIIADEIQKAAFPD